MEITSVYQHKYTHTIYTLELAGKYKPFFTPGVEIRGGGGTYSIYYIHSFSVVITNIKV